MVARGHRDNTELATPAEVSRALQVLEKLTGLDIRGGTLVRIDLTLCFESEGLPMEYSDLFQSHKSFKPQLGVKNGCLIKTSNFGLTLYDKGIEQFAKGVSSCIPQNHTRIELRIPVRAAQQIRKVTKFYRADYGEFSANSLTTNEGFLACLRCFEKVATKNLRLDELANSQLKTFATGNALFKHIALRVADTQFELCDELVMKTREMDRCPPNIVETVINELLAARGMATRVRHAVEVQNAMREAITDLERRFPVKIPTKHLKMGEEVDSR